MEVHSGSDNDRPQLTSAIAQAKKENAVLVVAKADRLSRKVSFIASLMEERGLEFKVAQMPYADAFQLHIYAFGRTGTTVHLPATTSALKSAKERGVRLADSIHHIDALAVARKEKALRDAEKVAGVIVPLRASECL